MLSRQEKLLSMGRIPAEPLLRVIEPEFDDWVFHSNAGDHYSKSPITVIAERAKITGDTLQKLVDRTNQSVDFNIADKIL